MALQHDFVRKISNSPFNTGDLVDNSVGIIPMARQTAPDSLQQRFLDCLSTLVGASTKMHADENRRSTDIFLSRDPKAPQGQLGLDEELRQLLQTIESCLELIAVHKYGPKCDRASEELWDAILFYVREDVNCDICKLRKIFDDNEDTMADFVTMMFGVNEVDAPTSDMNKEMGEHLIRLYHAVQSYTGSMKDIQALIQSASAMARVLLDFRGRLKYLIRKEDFAEGLYANIITLGMPERINSTLVRAARTSRTFEHIKFHLKPVSPPKRVTFGPPSLIKTSQLSDATPPTPPQTPPQSKEKSKHVKRSERAAQTSSVKVGEAGLLDAARPYLLKEDRAVGLVRLQPATKQDTVQLVGRVVRGDILPMQLHAWYAFGFVTVKDESEERHLAGLYAILLKEARNPEHIFRELLQALETNQLVALFDIKEYGHFRNIFPRLEAFLSTPPEQRPTVWRLKHFIQDTENTEPPACLQRDYGFKFCKQREEVQRLKDYYARMLKEMGPMDLHSACVHGRLFETAIREGLFIDLKDKRLMQNDYPSPFVGFDNDKGLASYRGPFFRRHLKL